MQDRCNNLVDDIKEKYDVSNLDDFLALSHDDLKVHHTPDELNAAITELEKHMNETFNTEVRDDIKDDINYNVFDLDISNRDDLLPIAFARINVNKHHVYISNIGRTNPSDNQHKGVIKKLLYIIVCKAIELNLDIDFFALPSCGTNHHKCNPSKLYKYYNNIGFTRKNKREWMNLFKPTPTNIVYSTKHKNLQKIVNNINKTRSPQSCFGRRCRR